MKAIDLAMVAAPFVAAGKTEAEAFRLARSLIDAAEEDTLWDPEPTECIPFKKLLKDLRLKDKRPVRGYLYSLFDHRKDDVEQIWWKVQKGTYPFTPAQLEKLHAARDAKRIKKARNALKRP